MCTVVSNDDDDLWIGSIAESMQCNGNGKSTVGYCIAKEPVCVVCRVCTDVRLL